MKKIVSIISCMMLSVILLVGCSCSCSKEKANLAIGDMNATSYVDLSSFEIVKSMIEDKETFVLFVYQVDCSACKSFKPILEEVIKERHIKVYGIQYKYIDSDHKLKDLQYTPSIVIYKAGKLFIKTDPDANSSYFKNSEGFKSFLDKYTDKPTAYYINLTQLREKISNQENFIIYYSRSSCGDCSYLNRNYLKEYLNSYSGDKKFYILETDAEGIRFNNGEYDSEQWQNIKDEFGLSKANNSEFGYETGVVPTFQYYENGVLRDMMIYTNDKFEEIEGTTDVKIIGSYYDDNPFIGETMNRFDYHNTVASFYNEKLKIFLDKNLELVD